VGYSGLR